MARSTRIPHTLRSIAMSSDPRTHRRLGSGLRAALLDRFPAARVLDEGVALDGEPLADLVLEDRGRLWWVLRAKRLDARTVRRVDATRAALAGFGDRLARALGSGATDQRVLLIVKHVEEGGRAALADALADGAVLVQRHRLRGDAGERLVLRRLAGDFGEPPRADAASDERGATHGALEREAARDTFEREATRDVPERGATAPLSGLPPGPARFVAALPAEHAPLAAELVRRQLRLDPELACEGDEYGLVWMRAEEVLCTLHAAADGVECRVAGVGVPRLVREAADLEEWLDFLLAQYFERWPAGEGPEPSFEIPRPEAGGGWLSAEEFEAFRDAAGPSGERS